MSDSRVDLAPTDQPIAEPAAKAAEEEARTLFFTPRRLGATAPHNCSIWSVDYRDDGDTECDGSASPPDTRRLEDESFTEELRTLMDAGLQVRI
jgi:hypothetical protein